MNIPAEQDAADVQAFSGTKLEDTGTSLAAPTGTGATVGGSVEGGWWWLATGALVTSFGTAVTTTFIQKKIKFTYVTVFISDSYGTYYTI